MLPKYTQIVTGVIGLILMAAFAIGLSESISTGFAGFWGGFPFMVIVLLVLPMAAYDVWDECIKKPRSKGGKGEQ